MSGLTGREKNVSKTESRKHRRQRSEQELQELKEKMRQTAPEIMDIFNQMDKAGNGVVTRHEFRLALNDMDIKMSNKEKDNLMKAIDTHGDDVIHLDELEEFLSDS
jgi:Ca2+-binding EF-hand superfamily protein